MYLVFFLLYITALLSLLVGTVEIEGFTAMFRVCVIIGLVLVFLAAAGDVTSIPSLHIIGE